jgi:hypothetical protein
LGAAAAAEKCPSDSVAVGPACIDRDEASVWETTNAGLIKKIKKGKATLSRIPSLTLYTRWRTGVPNIQAI